MKIISVLSRMKIISQKTDTNNQILNPAFGKTFLFFMMFAIYSTYLAQISEGNFKDAFSYGREYFIMRSGNTQLILQSDKTGILPAYSYMLFDAEAPCQSLRKDKAFNFSEEKLFTESALEVVIGKNAFTALGINTSINWTEVEGVPSIEIVWWAGGIKVVENLIAVEGKNAFIRTIKLISQNMAGPETISIRLSLPEGVYRKRDSILIGSVKEILMGITLIDTDNLFIDDKEGYIEIPITIKPGEVKVIKSLLAAVIPAKGINYINECDKEKGIDPKYLSAIDDSGNRVKGMKYEFFNNINLSGEPVITTIDTNTVQYWGELSPAIGINPDSFSIRWTAKLKVPVRGNIRFTLVSDDKARLFVDNDLVIDCWENSLNVLKTAELNLDTGADHDLRVEYCDLESYAGIRLKWIMPITVIDEKIFEQGIHETFINIEKLKKENLVRTEKMWAQRNKINSSDTLIKRLYYNASNSLDGMVSENGRMNAGIFEYGLQWVRDGSSVALGLIHSGNFESARSLLNYILSELVSPEGTTVVAGGFDEPDREEFDQMGELVHSLKAYFDWTGDDSLIKKYKNKIISMVERPLDPRFRDSTGMVHNRREYWERAFDDAYELAYQTWMIRGLHDAADLADELEVPEKKDFWRSEAGKFYEAMTGNPTKSLVVEGAFIKRRNVTGEIADIFEGVTYFGDLPMGTERFHKLNPDASYALPILLNVIDPKSDLSLNTLEELEKIWNARWNFGGYERYHSSSQGDQPGPWCFATAFIARAQQDAGLLDRSRRALNWLYNVQGGNSGAWYEEIPIARSEFFTCGIVPWASAEVATFTVKNWLGFNFENDKLVIKPNLFPENVNLSANLRFRSNRINVKINKAGEIDYAVINGNKVYPEIKGAVIVPEEYYASDINIEIYTK